MFLNVVVFMLVSSIIGFTNKTDQGSRQRFMIGLSLSIGVVEVVDV